MSFGLHIRARESIDRKALELFGKLEEIPQSPPLKRRKSSVSEAEVKKISISEIISFGPLSTVSPTGKVLSKSFLNSGSNIGLKEEGYALLDKLVSRLLEKEPIRAKLSKQFIEGLVFEWLEIKYKGELDETNEGFFDFFENESSKAINTYLVTIPFNKWLTIESPFNVGKVRLDYYTKEIFDDQLDYMIDKSPGKEEDLRKGIDIWKRKYSGLVYGSIEVETELSRGMEILREHLHWSLVVLRCFCPASFTPRIACYFDTLGNYDASVDHALVFENNILTLHSGFVDKNQFWWRVSDIELDQLKKQGLEEASTLITQEKKTEFEITLLESMHQFSRSILSTKVNDKLVFILSSIETLLVKDAREPIVYSVGKRLAVLVGQGLSQRKQILKNFQAGYEYRSNYLHSGLSDNDISVLEQLQLTIRTAIMTLLVNRNRFRTKEEMIGWLEDKMLSP